MLRGQMSDWESLGEIYTDQWTAAVFSSWPQPSGQLDKTVAKTKSLTTH